MRASLKLVGPATDAHDAADDAAPVVARERSLLRFITCGSVDDGKSTLLGRLLFETGAVFDDQMEALDRDSARFGTTGGDLDFALLVDGLAAEREQGITIDVAYRYFSTDKRAFIAADTPGHEQYTRNMATGASTADVAIILVDARKGLLPQTRRHSYIVSMLGVRRVIVAVNKIDLVDYDEQTFRKIERDYRALATSLGFVETHVIPVSARFGDNVATPSDKTPWRSGPSLLALLETIAVAPTGDSEFRLPIQWINRPNLDFRGFSGTIASGAVAIGDTIVVLPRGRATRVLGILGPSGAQERADAGEAVTLTLADEIDVSRGDVLVHVGSPIRPLRQFQARLLALGEAPVTPGRAYLVKIGTAVTAARIVALHHAVDVHNYQTSPAAALAMNGIGLATLRLETDIVAEDYATCQSLGGILLIDPHSNDTVALGVVEARADKPKGEYRIVGTLARFGLVSPDATFEELRRRTIDATANASLTGLIALTATRDVVSALAAACADFVLRPLLGATLVRVRSWVAMRRRDRHAAGLSLDGGGI
ncbi:MAG: sulfate adenylyltransferase [Rhodoblastus sp.]|nr:sulfate adenylyltransferase [Rhodoblastus sp.]